MAGSSPAMTILFSIVITGLDRRSRSTRSRAEDRVPPTVENDKHMKKVLDSVTLFEHVFAMLEKWASNLSASRLAEK
jgi:hypothetical protein